MKEKIGFGLIVCSLAVILISTICAAASAQCPANPADTAFAYYDALNGEQAQKTLVMFNSVQKLVRLGRVKRGPEIVVAQALMESIAGKNIDAQLRFNSARDDEDKLRAAADSAAALRFWGRPQEILKNVLRSAPPPKKAKTPSA